MNTCCLLELIAQLLQRLTPCLCIATPLIALLYLAGNFSEISVTIRLMNGRCTIPTTTGISTTGEAATTTGGLSTVVKIE